MKKLNIYIYDNQNDGDIWILDINSELFIPDRVAVVFHNFSLHPLHQIRY